MTILNNMQNQIDEKREALKLDRSRNMHHARHLFKMKPWLTWGECLSEAWRITNEYRLRLKQELINAITRLANRYTPEMNINPEVAMLAAYKIDSKFYR